MGYPNTQTLNRDIIFEEQELQQLDVRESTIDLKRKTNGYFPPLNVNGFQGQSNFSRAFN